MTDRVVIVGAGPAGLSCAIKLAELGLSCIIIERKKEIGKKVCAGGITCNGIMEYIPDTLIQREFCEQHIFFNRHSFILKEKTSILATINRIEFGRHLAKVARKAGVKILKGYNVVNIDKNNTILKIKRSGKNRIENLPFSILVGADGSSSVVRRSLQLNTESFGIGINFQIQGKKEGMEWHFSPKHFRGGYGWIFPHSDSFSIGSFADSRFLPGKRLLKETILWAKENGIDLQEEKAASEKIAYDFRGCCFNNIYLAGEAAGLASAITGEGINAAIISGKEIAKKISAPDYKMPRLIKLAKRQRQHKTLIDLMCRYRIARKILPTAAYHLLRFKIIHFSKLELTAR